MGGLGWRGRRGEGGPRVARGDDLTGLLVVMMVMAGDKFRGWRGEKSYRRWWCV